MAFISSFPLIPYDIDRSGKKQYDLITDIFFRIAFLKAVKNNISAYFPYIVENADSPDIVAAKVYNDPQMYWIVLLANDIVDPNFDWPMGQWAFESYIVQKYGSIAEATNTIHHYEKITTRRYNGTETQYTDTTFTSQIDYSDPRSNTDPSFAFTNPTIPYDTYVDLPTEETFTALTTQHGASIDEIIISNSVSAYDYEFELNQKKRRIKMIYPESVGQIQGEFDNLILQYNPQARLGLKSARI